MSKIVVRGGNKLHGEVNISTAKNSVLPIIAACILSGDKCIIEEVPMLEDVFVISDILRSIFADISIDKSTNRIIIDTSNVKDCDSCSELVKKMRASFLIMGPMISRFGRFKLSLPGGCNIGTRPIDLHLKGFSALGAEVNIGHGYVEARAKKLVGNKIYLDFPSVGATENIMMAAVMAEGETIIENAAEEPEIKDLAKFLNSMGARITGAGSGTIHIIGVKDLKGSIHKPICDRIEAGTFMVAASITRSKIKINGINEEHLKPIIAKLTEAGVYIKVQGNSLIVDGNRDLNPIDIKTMPYPGFPTDMQSQMTGLLCTVRGTSIITETIFENRFMHVVEMKRMGANIKIDGRSAVIEGVDKLTGAEVKATDLRAGAALILCGLAAEGETEVMDIYHVDRGYVDIEKKLKGLGADIERIQ
ncbi:UDP-N-acetylglucosamine 1-carboxyvinyltransferase [Clostridium luticellarii]|jgi:UDP-N-acetylglucosamine 1-carboxyvinyltransferase|uniref:UDP-N-acetylglucosamine 1-carboxyvinyltransferase n=1 Tax=Clostridium luticellarii TaxID=1691940 RepID=A0A2T0BQS1_9CLOT|nr:UDP-N-acetylglucosamine 1-carboxyvinyltransferase [Clostridium luticellarii]MCI1945316.1 UDP-N-acetylglucosamine 1-carboxyvinyltransferase [Clostridium luticellarii]MCI1968623.1 UDP-N-acetylglucosamine 1-carboxyvinyltransferase [Clostridium luticellarii]MCI1995803.1 UDP-N-acetylglucosamine 1-carboxyvinyltransferase [Clostridium luticellarii]MCI2040097.1 UDP-N-acetylglucosamine 1-carboxyvinyltransferase [Clostridium luticellarii]PRR86195.1 UDP-N-acetylglucosamine 1-carboxyvinyltransferase 1 